MKLIKIFGVILIAITILDCSDQCQNRNLSSTTNLYQLYEVDEDCSDFFDTQIIIQESENSISLSPVNFDSVKAFGHRSEETKNMFSVTGNFSSSELVTCFFELDTGVFSGVCNLDDGRECHVFIRLL